MAAGCEASSWFAPVLCGSFYITSISNCSSMCAFCFGYLLRQRG